MSGEREVLQLCHLDGPRGRSACAARLGGDDHELDAAEGTVGQHGHLGRVWVRAGFGLGVWGAGRGRL